MPPSNVAMRRSVLPSNASRPDVQARIRTEIREGTIRVRPWRDGGIIIAPAAGWPAPADRRAPTPGRGRVEGLAVPAAATGEPGPVR